MYGDPFIIIYSNKESGSETIHHCLTSNNSDPFPFKMTYAPDQLLQIYDTDIHKTKPHRAVVYFTPKENRALPVCFIYTVCIWQ